MGHEAEHVGAESNARTRSCHGCRARASSAWASLPEDVLHILSDGKEVRLYGPGQVVFHEDTRPLGLFCVQSGTVALRKEDASGNGIIVALAGPGCLLGHAEYFCGTPAWTTACALCESRACFINGDTMDRVTEQSRDVLIDVLRRVGGELECAEGELLRQAVMPVRARVAALLLSLRDHHGSVDSDGRLVITLPVSRADLAALLRARRETVSRALHQLASDGVVTVRGRAAIVPDLDVLMDEIKEFTGM